MSTKWNKGMAGRGWSHTCNQRHVRASCSNDVSNRVFRRVKSLALLVGYRYASVCILEISARHLSRNANEYVPFPRTRELNRKLSRLESSFENLYFEREELSIVSRSNLTVILDFHERFWIKFWNTCRQSWTKISRLEKEWEIRYEKPRTRSSLVREQVHTWPSRLVSLCPAN